LNLVSSSRGLVVAAVVMETLILIQTPMVTVIAEKSTKVMRRGSATTAPTTIETASSTAKTKAAMEALYAKVVTGTPTTIAILRSAPLLTNVMMGSFATEPSNVTP